MFLYSFVFVIQIKTSLYIGHTSSRLALAGVGGSQNEYIFFFSWFTYVSLLDYAFELRGSYQESLLLVLQVLNHSCLRSLATSVET